MLVKQCNCDVCKKEITGRYETFIHTKKQSDGKRLKIQVCPDCFKEIFANVICNNNSEGNK